MRRPRNDRDANLATETENDTCGNPKTFLSRETKILEELTLRVISLKKSHGNMIVNRGVSTASRRVDEAGVRQSKRRITTPRR